jgi:hypothetical protein
MVRSRRGASSIGCLLSVLVVAAILYFGYNIGIVFWTNYQYVDRMKQEAHFASHRSDAVIKRRLSEYADSLGLPEAAGNVTVRRSPNSILIWSDYYLHIELPGFVRELHFSPSATGSF